jgi:8-oxo-dGTP pyrophosphatase MutT (NUDIX family)
MKEVTLNIKVEKPFGNLFRKKCALVAVFDHENKLLLGEKPHFYPPTITRLLGGGVDVDENPAHAAVRELAEELGVNVAKDDLKEIAAYVVNAIDSDGNTYNSTTYLFSARIGDQKYNAGDDVKFISRFDQADLQRLVNSYNSLPKTLWYKGQEGEFSWYDYAQVYGAIHHEVALDWEKNEVSKS